MSEQPDCIDIGATSFKPKESFKPLQNTTLFNPKTKPKGRNIPGGEWGVDEPKTTHHQEPEIKPKPNSFVKMIDIDKQEESQKEAFPEKKEEEKKDSGFKFIKKAKKTEEPSPFELPSLSTIKSDSL